MSEFKGTPGPWGVSKDSSKIIIRKYHDGSDGYLIASLCGNDKSGFYASEAEAEANMALVLAAPELLEALQAMFRAGQKQNWNERYESVMSQARTAIAKALGGNQS